MVVFLVLVLGSPPDAIHMHSENAVEERTLNMEGANTEENADKLVFERSDNGLQWPILNFGDITLVMTHGVHCIEVMRHNDSSEIHRFHKEHCASLAAEILSFFESSPNYTVPEVLCEDIRAIAFPGGRIRRGNWWGWRNGKRKRSVDMLPQSRGTRQYQNDKYNILAARNFVDLLLKEAQGGKLTSREVEYLREARSPQSVRIAALGLFCKYDGYIDIVREIIEEGAQLKGVK